MTASSVLEISEAALILGGKTLWSGLNLSLSPGEFLAVIGPNGSGKTSLLKAILGRLKVDSGQIEVLGKSVGEVRSRIGYIPQQGTTEQPVGLRGKDLVALGIDGHKWGPPIRSRKDRELINDALADLEAGSLADIPLGMLSGGQQQRLRVAQALAGSPELLLCDEPFLSLDLKYQQKVIEAIRKHQLRSQMAVVFVTHDVNPILGLVDRLLYFTGGQFLLGTPEQVLDSKVLSKIYGTRVEVHRQGGRVTIIGAPDDLAAHHPESEVEAH